MSEGGCPKGKGVVCGVFWGDWESIADLEATESVLSGDDEDVGEGTRDDGCPDGGTHKDYIVSEKEVKFSEGLRAIRRIVG